MKIERDLNGFLTDECRDKMVDSLPIIIWRDEYPECPELIWNISSWLDWSGELFGHVEWTDWSKIIKID